MWTCHRASKIVPSSLNITNLFILHTTYYSQENICFLLVFLRINNNKKKFKPNTYFVLNGATILVSKLMFWYTIFFLVYRARNMDRVCNYSEMIMRCHMSVTVAYLVVKFGSHWPYLEKWMDQWIQDIGKHAITEV